MKQASQQRSGTPARPGFTLLETLLAIGLMSMIAAVLIGGSSTLLKSTVRSDPEDALRALLSAGPPAYVALLGYMAPDERTDRAVAGLRAAIEARQNGKRTAIICKSLFGKAHTVMAEGGIAAAMGNVNSNDSW